VGKTNRAPRRKKKGDDIDIVEGYHDDVCVRLRDRMYTAAENDRKANSKKMPATSKLAMLDEVVGALQNTTLWSSIIDNEVLKAVKMWLEPLPDKSLPAVGIQKAVFEVLPKMDLDTATIREAGLGAIVLFYTKTKRVTPSINRAAEALVQTWSRPIIKRPADFRSRYIQTADDLERPEYDEYDEDGEPRESRPKPKAKTKQQRFNVAEALVENRDRKGARLPNVRDVQYTVAPESRLTHRSGETGYIARIQQDNKKFNRFARQLKGQKTGR
jgi:transcription factor SPN1